MSYDEAYISRIISVEGCTRDKAIALIAEFEAIDEEQDLTPQQRAVIKYQTPEVVHKRIAERKEEKRCQCCGRADNDTRNGKSRCRACALRQSQYYYKHKEKWAK